MKKFLRFICLIAVQLAALALLLCGCSSPSAERDDFTGTASVCVSFTATENAPCVKDYLDLLKDSGEISYDGEEGQYGFFITEVMGREAKASRNEFWAVYTTLTEYEGVIYSDQTYGVFVYGGITMYSASYGVSGLICVAGESYALVLQTY